MLENNPLGKHNRLDTLFGDASTRRAELHKICCLSQNDLLRPPGPEWEVARLVTYVTSAVAMIQNEIISWRKKNALYRVQLAEKGGTEEPMAGSLPPKSRETTPAAEADSGLINMILGLKTTPKDPKAYAGDADLIQLIRVHIQYLQFDREVLIRENNYLRKILEDES